MNLVLLRRDQNNDDSTYVKQANGFSHSLTGTVSHHLCGVYRPPLLMSLAIRDNGLREKTDCEILLSEHETLTYTLFPIPLTAL